MDGYIRIGELSRRTGVSPELLRAWERRYGLFEPDRSPGRFRLYSDTDLERVVSMRRQIEGGLSAAEAARRVLAVPADAWSPAAPAAPAIEEPVRALRSALAGFDDAAAHAALDRLIASLSLETLLREVVLPLLRDIGEGWERGEVTVAQEHFASNVLRGRLLALGRGWGRGSGRHALLAAPSGEQHDLGLVVLALMLRDRGWRVTFLGADTPIATVLDTAGRVAPDVVVLSQLSELELDRKAVRALAREHRVVVCGAGATQALARSLGAEYYAGDPVEAAEFLADGVTAES